MNWPAFIMVFGAWIMAMAALAIGLMSLPDIVEWIEGGEMVDEE